MFVYELSCCGFKSRCIHLKKKQEIKHPLLKKCFLWRISCRFVYVHTFTEKIRNGKFQFCVQWTILCPDSRILSGKPDKIGESGHWYIKSVLRVMKNSHKSIQTQNYQQLSMNSTKMATVNLTTDTKSFITQGISLPKFRNWEARKELDTQVSQQVYNLNISASFWSICNAVKECKILGKWQIN